MARPLAYKFPPICLGVAEDTVCRVVPLKPSQAIAAHRSVACLGASDTHMRARLEIFGTRVPSALGAQVVLYTTQNSALQTVDEVVDLGRDTDDLSVWSMQTPHCNVEQVHQTEAFVLNISLFASQAVHTWHCIQRRDRFCGL